MQAESFFFIIAQSNLSPRTSSWPV